jgi:hypothetical protein
VQPATLFGAPAQRYVFDVWSRGFIIYEPSTFVAEARRLWSTEERLEFFAWIASEPDAGAVIKDSGGCRKVRWSRPGTSKRDGVRVIYFTRLAAGELCMLLVYPKSGRDTIPGHLLRMIRKEIEDGIDQAG